MKQELRRQQTTQLLLDTTKKLIQEKGCHSITMQDIMDRSGLSKGAIFHYVKSKDEIFAWVLQEKLEDINQRFMEQVNRGKKEFAGPMRQITENLPTLQDPKEITNQVLVYLLGKSGQPEINDVLMSFYQHSVNLSRHWIATGQQHGVIPESVETNKTAELFVLITLGLRMRSFLATTDFTFNADDLSSFLTEMLGNSQ